MVVDNKATVAFQKGIAKENEQLDVLGGLLSSLKSQSLEMKRTLNRQNEMIDNMGDHMDDVEVHLKQSNQQAADLLKHI